MIFTGPPFPASIKFWPHDAVQPIRVWWVDAAGLVSRDDAVVVYSIRDGRFHRRTGDPRLDSWGGEYLLAFIMHRWIGPKLDLGDPERLFAHGPKLADHPLASLDQLGETNPERARYLVRAGLLSPENMGGLSDSQEQAQALAAFNTTPAGRRASFVAVERVMKSDPAVVQP